MLQKEPPTLGQIIYELMIRPTTKKPCDPQDLREQMHTCLINETDIGNCARVISEYRSCVGKIDKQVE